MLKISYAGGLGLSSAISSQFSVKMCVASKNCEKFIKTRFWEFKSKKSLSSASYNKQHVCTYLQPFSHYTSQ